MKLLDAKGSLSDGGFFEEAFLELQKRAIQYAISASVHSCNMDKADLNVQEVSPRL